MLSTTTLSRLRRGAVLALVPGTLVLAGCGDGGKTVNRTISAAMVQGKAGWAPSAISVDKGDKVNLKVDNLTAVPHGFKIEGYPAVKDQIEEPGKPVTVRFTANKAGTFTIRCQLHPAHQTAQLIVK